MSIEEPTLTEWLTAIERELYATPFGAGSILSGGSHRAEGALVRLSRIQRHIRLLNQALIRHIVEDEERDVELQRYRSLVFAARAFLDDVQAVPDVALGAVDDSRESA